MIVIHKIKIDMQASAVPEVVNVVQLDSNTRVIQAALYSGNVPFEIGNNASVSLACFKPDRTKCWYDELPNGNPAASVEGNVVSITLAPEVLTAAGSVNAAIVIREGLTDQISTFPFWICVARNPAAGSIISNNYYKVSDLESLNSWMKEVLCCTPQEWTAEQQAQARQNIGAMAAGIQKSLAINSTEDTAADVVLESELRESGTAAMQFYSGGADVGAEHHTILGGLADGENDTDAATVGQVKEMVSQSACGTVKTVNGIAPDENGNVEIETGGTGSNTDSQVKIEGTPIEQTCIKFAKMLYGTDKAESFIYFTDPHLCNPPNADAENKMLTSLKILKTYYDATPTSFLVCGGDWLNDIYNGQTNDDACYKLGYAASLMRAYFDRCYTAIGNHEDNYPYGAAYEGAGRNTVEVGLSMETIRNIMLPYEKELYYSFDGAQTKFYVMNSSDVENDQQMTAYRWEQVAWLAEKLKEDDAENSALVIHSALLRPIGGGVFAHLAENLLKLCQAYNQSTTITLNGVSYDFAGCTGCVRFMMAGHVHDGDCAETHYGIPVILTRNMMASADSGNGYKPTFDLCLANYDTEMLRMVRVGNYGTDREVPMASRTATGSIFTVSMNLTDVIASNTAINVREGNPYENTLTVPNGYTLSAVAVTMGGEDITATAYSNGQISIVSITGDIVITATASVTSTDYTNLVDLASEDTLVDSHYFTDGAIIEVEQGDTSVDKIIITNFIPVIKGDVLRFKGLDQTTGINGKPSYMICYDENKEFLLSLQTKESYLGQSTALPTSAIPDENGVVTYTILIRGDTNEQFTYKEYCDKIRYVRFSAHYNDSPENVIVTVNEEIYPSESIYTNLVPTALANDGVNVYNDPYGYQNGYVLSGKAEASTATSGDCVTTGFIKGPAKGDVIYVKGSNWVTGDNYCRFWIYSAFGNDWANAQEGTSTTNNLLVPEQLGDKYWKFTCVNDFSKYWYRFTLRGNVNTDAGEELIITHNEPIE